MNNFEKVIADVMAYAHPEYLLKEHTVDLDRSKVDDKELEKYLKLLIIISQAHKKVKRYGVYFVQFYPGQPGEISEAEALEHHIHAYLEDCDCLRNKILVFFDVLSKDVRRTATNSQEWAEAFQYIKDQIYKVFKGIAQHRAPHHHAGMRFADSDIIDADIFGLMTGPESPFRDQMSAEMVEDLKQRTTESFEKAKQRWINMGARNQEQIDGAMDKLFGDIRSVLYQYLQIQSFIDRGEEVVHD